MYRALGFDLDNTLYDQGQHLRSFFREAGYRLSRRSSVPAQTAEESFLRVWERRTMAYPYLFDEALQDLGLWRADWVRELVARYRSHRCSLALLDGVRPMLERLAGRYPLFLITDGDGELQRFKVGQLRISKFFRLILYTGDYGAGWCKPATHLFARASTLLHLPAEACLFIGDDPDRDMEGARRAGMATARVLNGPYRHRPCLPPPDLVLNRFIELESVLEPLTPATGEGIGGGEPWARSVSCM